MKIGIIGLGPFCKSNYINYIKENINKYKIEISFVIELDSNRREIVDFFQSENLPVQEYIFINDEERFLAELEIETINQLEALINKNPVDIVIISTEPKSHFKYLKYFISQNTHILVDKPPVCGFDYEFGKLLGQKMIYEMEEINNLLDKNKNTKCIITAQRRTHKGFMMVKNILEGIVAKYNLPINYIECFHSDGMWNMPDELIYRENHPYRFGYGKIMHSGYHFLDTMFWLEELNKNIEKYSINTTRFSCRDFAESIKNNSYKQLLNTNKFESLLRNVDSYRGFGELDSYNIFQFKRKNDTVISTCSVNLLQNSFTRRAWAKLPQDTYKLNGRLRHEFWNIQIAPVMCIQIYSVQSYENRNSVEHNSFHQGDIGSEDHFDINIFKNTALIKGKAFEQIKLGGREMSLMKQARFAVIDQLFKYVSKNSGHKINLESEFIQHNNTITAVAEIYNLYKLNQYVISDIKYFDKKN